MENDKCLSPNLNINNSNNNNSNIDITNSTNIDFNNTNDLDNITLNESNKNQTKKREYPYPCPGESAGWTCDYESPFSSRNGQHYFCDVDVVSPNISYDEFVEKYLFRKPVLINSTMEDWTDPSFWSRDSLLSYFGNFKFESGRSLELVLNSGIGAIDIPLKDYLDDPMQLQLEKDTMGPYDHLFKEPLYIFDRSIWRHEKDFRSTYFHPPSYLFNGDPQYGILFIGITGTGATWHGHGETWAGVAYGRKRWFLYPPEVTPPGGFWPGYSARDWFKWIYPNLHEELPKDEIEYNTPIPITRHSVYTRRKINPETNETQFIMIDSESTIEEILATDFEDLNKKKKYGLYKPLECVQGEGQLLYLPEFWFHAVLNVGDVIAGGIQTSESYTSYMQQIDILSRGEKLINDDKRMKSHFLPLTDLQKQLERWEMLRAHERLAEMAPNNGIHPFFVGFEYDNLGYRKEAIQYIEKSLRIDPTYIEAYVSLAAIYGNMGNSYRLKQEKLLRIAYRLNPHHPTVREALTKVFKHQNRADLMELVAKHAPLPNMRSFDERHIDDENLRNIDDNNNYYYDDNNNEENDSDDSDE